MGGDRATPGAQLASAGAVNSTTPNDAARLAAARAGLAGAREAQAAGPRAGVEGLRAAYLDLLKLSLCDLAGPTTVSVSALPGGGVASRELSGYWLRLRSAGMDWPLQGVTMTGLARLDDLQSCVETVVEEGVEGDLIEAGAWRGGSSILMRAVLDSHGDDRDLHVADSFQGFPESDQHDRPGGALNTFEFLSVSVEDVRANFVRLGLEEGVTFVPGFFEDTLPGLAGGKWALVRLDGDTYEATRVGLESLYDGLSEGGYLVVDDYGAFDECRRAVDEFRAERGIAEPIEAVDWTCVRWRKGDAATGAGAPALDGRPPTSPVTPPRPTALHTARELELADEAEELRARLAAAEAEVARVNGSLAARIGRRLRGGGRP
jgi:O-methyltransferase